MLDNQALTLTLVTLNVIFVLWVFVIALYHYFLHRELTETRQKTQLLEDVIAYHRKAEKDLRDTQDLIKLRDKLNRDN